MNKSILIAALVAIGLAACGKEAPKVEAPKVEAPKVEVAAPAAPAVEAAKDAAGAAVDAAKDAAGKSVDAAKDAAGKTVDAAKDAAGKTVDAAKDAAAKSVEAAKAAAPAAAPAPLQKTPRRSNSALASVVVETPTSGRRFRLLRRNTDYVVSNDSQLAPGKAGVLIGNTDPIRIATKRSSQRCLCQLRQIVRLRQMRGNHMLQF